MQKEKSKCKMQSQIAKKMFPETGTFRGLESSVQNYNLISGGQTEPVRPEN